MGEQKEPPQEGAVRTQQPKQTKEDPPKTKENLSEVEPILTLSSSSFRGVQYPTNRK